MVSVITILPALALFVLVSGHDEKAIERVVLPKGVRGIPAREQMDTELSRSEMDEETRIFFGYGPLVHCTWLQTPQIVLAPCEKRIITGVLGNTCRRVFKASSAITISCHVLWFSPCGANRLIFSDGQTKIKSCGFAPPAPFTSQTGKLIVRAQVPSALWKVFKCTVEASCEVTDSPTTTTSAPTTTASATATAAPTTASGPTTDGTATS